MGTITICLHISKLPSFIVAYQFLVKTYVEERKEKMKDSSMFLDMDVLKKRNDRRKSMVNLGDGDASPGNPSSRRGSFVKTEEPVKDMKQIDQERRQAKKDAKQARYVKPISLNHQSHFYIIVTSSWYQTTKQQILYPQF